MSELGSLFDLLREPRLSVHALSALPAWLFSPDGRKILWANPTGAAIFDAPSPAAVIDRAVDQSIASQIESLAVTMTAEAAPRLARLRELAVGFGRALTCQCSRIQLPERQSAILVVATEVAGPQLSPREQMQRLIAGIDIPVAFFSPDGQLVGATPSGLAKFSGAHAALGIEALVAQALAHGHASSGEIIVDRIGTEPAIVLMASFGAKRAVKAPVATAVPPSTIVAPDVRTNIPTPALPERRQPMRFVWQMDANGHFTLGSNEFSRAIGPRTATALGRPWHEIAAALGLDGDGKITRAIAGRESFSGITLHWPADDTDERFTVELSGFPLFDRERVFGGYRGFGVCRDVARLTALVQARRSTPVAPPSPTVSEPQRPAAHVEPPVQTPAAPPPASPVDKAPDRPVLSVVPPSKNVVPFRSSAPPPGLSAVERKAFHEIARQLTSRLGITDAPPMSPDTPAPLEPSDLSGADEPAFAPLGDDTQAPPPISSDGETQILDRLPVGVLLYRHDALIYANRTFLEWTGYQNIEALARAGGVDRLFSAPDVELVPETGAKSLAITTSQGEALPVEGRLFTIPGDGESILALVLMLASGAANERQKQAEMSLRVAESEARELKSILDTATDGVVVLDHQGNVLAGNRSAEALFGYESHELTNLTFADLFAPESERVALDYLDGLVSTGVASVLNDGREVIGRVREGGLIPLFMTMGRIGDGDEKLCAVFRDITQWKKAEEELLNAKQEAEKISSAKSEFLAKISHEIRTPLNSIIGFSEVMMEERFGPIGNERYKQYIKDVHASGGHVVSLLNDLLDLSKIEAGKLELTFARVNLNDEVQQCVALMQPQANRERTIIRTSLAQKLPQVVADARSVKQIVINLLSNSIKFTGPGGQVIVSTALSDGGEVVLRVRDTGVGMSEQDIAVALEPFRQLPTAARWGSSGTGLGLPLTKALAEANRAKFSITSKPNAGTLVEIAFPSTRVLAE